MSQPILEVALAEHYEELLKNAPECNLCKKDYFQNNSEEELAEEFESVKSNQRCIGCVDEWGYDSWPDQQ